MTQEKSIVAALLDLSEYLESGAEPDHDRRMSRICNTLRPHSGSDLVSRAYLQAALLSGSPNQIRFVTDVLIESDLTDMARPLAEEAAKSATKQWQRDKLARLKDHACSVAEFDHRRSFSLTIGAGGVTTVGPTSGTDADPAPSATEPLSAERWVSELSALSAAGGVGFYPDVLRVYLADEFDEQVLSKLLSLTQILPLAPVIIAQDAQQASRVQRACLKRQAEGTLLSPAGLAVLNSMEDGRRAEAFTFVGLMDRCLLTAKIEARRAERPLHELEAQMLGATAAWLSFKPAFRDKRPLVFEALRREASQILPLSSKGRTIGYALAYQASGREWAREIQNIAGHLLGAGFYDEALGALEAVPELQQGKYYVRRLIRALYGVGDFESLCNRRFDGVDSAPEAQMVREAREASRMLEELEGLQAEKPSVPFEPIEHKVVSVLHASQPSQSGGYANRAHQILHALHDRGFEVMAYTRPGFPEGENSLAPGEVGEEEYDGIAYRRIGTERSRKSGEYAYMAESVAHYRKIFLQERPSVVHLRSTYVSALPGCIAAKSLGLPVVYEVSGMWELVYEAKNEARMEGRRARTVALENAVLHAADGVSTLTGAMRDIIRERVSLKAPVKILPNAVDAQRFAPKPKSEAVLQRLGWTSDLPVIGYAGTFVDYEGLDVLMQALAILKTRSGSFQALMVGDGAVHAQISHLAGELGLEERVHFTGRVPHDDVDELYSVVDICVYPRKRTPATVAVSPLKPFEALASEKTVIVSDVPALAEIAGDNERALIVRQSDAADLAEALQSAMEDPMRMSAMRKRARSWVEQERSWSAVGAAFADLLTEHALKAGLA